MPGRKQLDRAVLDRVDLVKRQLGHAQPLGAQAIELGGSRGGQRMPVGPAVVGVAVRDVCHRPAQVRVQPEAGVGQVDAPFVLERQVVQVKAE